MRAECVWPAGAVLGEGALWDEGRGQLWWVDIKGPALNRYDPANGARWSWMPPCRITALGLAGSDRLIASSDLGFVLVEPEAERLVPLHHPETAIPGNRFNDGKVDPQGYFWAGSMDDAEEETTRGTLYRFAPDGSCEAMLGGFHVPNGPAFAHDGRSFYVNDTARRRTDRVRLDGSGAIAARETFLTFAEGEGYPDGMTVDAAGNLWIAFWDGWCVRCFSPEGAPIDRIELPVARPTSCAFGGPALDQLFITSASVGLSDAERDEQPLAGGLFVVPGVARGVAAPHFGGATRAAG